jgi:hypothetical protein
MLFFPSKRGKKNHFGNQAEYDDGHTVAAEQKIKGAQQPRKGNKDKVED